MDLQLVSDLHLNTMIFGKNTSTSALTSSLWMPTPYADNLIILGDTWEGDKLFKYGTDHYSWMAHVAKLYKKVYILLGNHDYYGSYPQRMIQKWQKHISDQNLHNVILLNNNSVELAPGLFLFGGTGWTDIKRTPHSLQDYYRLKKYDGKYYFTDFGEIKKNTHQRIHPSDWQKWHDDYMKELIFHLSTHTLSTTIVASHMPLVMQSLDNTIPYANTYPPEVANNVDASDYLKVLQQYDVPIHLHGHVHQGMNYNIPQDGSRIGNGLQVVCNPYGYTGDISRGKDYSKILPFQENCVVFIS